MNRSISFALAIMFCVSAVSAQAAGPKGKVGNHKPVRVTKALGTNVGVSNGIGNITNPIVNTPPKTAPGFPYNPNGLQMGHGPVVLNPIHHGPINGLPVFPHKPQPTCNSHKCCDHNHYCYNSMPIVSTSCGNDCSNYSLDDSGNDPSIDQSTDQSAAQSSDESSSMDE